MAVTVVQDHLKEIVAGIGKLSDTRVMVGIPSEKAGRSEGPITNAELGYIHENGAPEVNIPARPFLKPGVASIQDDIVRRLENVGQAATEGRADAVDRGLNALGLVASAAVKRKISSNIPPPLKPGTIAARKRRGRTSTRTLIDTGQLRNAITYVIRKV